MLLQSQYTFSLLLFVFKNRDLLRSNSEIRNISTRYNSDLHLPTASLKVFQKAVFYSRIRIFNHFPSTIQDLLYDAKQFKLALKRFLLTNYFYCLEEHFDWKYIRDLGYLWYCILLPSIILYFKWILKYNTYVISYYNATDSCIITQIINIILILLISTSINCIKYSAFRCIYFSFVC